MGKQNDINYVELKGCNDNNSEEFNTLSFVIDSKNGFHWLSQKF